jgi:hypothetical protein
MHTAAEATKSRRRSRFNGARGLSKTHRLKVGLLSPKQQNGLVFDWA